MEVLLWTRLKAVLISASAVFVMGIPSALTGTGTLFKNWSALYNKDYFSTLDYLTGSWMLPVSALLTTIFAGWFLEKKFAEEEFMKGATWPKLFKPWIFFVKWVSPLAIIFIILQEGGVIDINRLFR